MDTPKTITEQIHSRGLSDTEVAQRVGSSQPTIWRIRTGKTTDCSSDLYRKLAALKDELEPVKSLPPVLAVVANSMGVSQ